MSLRDIHMLRVNLVFIHLPVAYCSIKQICQLYLSIHFKTRPQVAAKHFRELPCKFPVLKLFSMLVRDTIPRRTCAVSPYRQFLWGMYQEGRSLSRRIMKYITSIEMVWLPPSRAAAAYFPPPVVQSFVSTHLHQHLVLSDFTVFANLIWNTISVGFCWALLWLLVGLNFCLLTWLSATRDSPSVEMPACIHCPFLSVVVSIILLLTCTIYLYVPAHNTLKL